MQILPAIDIKNGRAVRLYKGDFEQETVVAIWNSFKTHL